MNELPHVIVVSNARPTAGGEGRSCGAVTAVEPLLTASGGVWLAPRSEPEHRVDAGPSYHVEMLPMSVDERHAFLDNVCHSGLWPLCHRAGVAATFDAAAFEIYRDINDRLASAAGANARLRDSVVFVQNYHFALVPRQVRQRWPEARLATFWHVPWPGIDRLERCPWHRELIAGLLGSDVLGFQTPVDCVEFLESAEMLLGAAVDRGTGIVAYAGRDVLVRDYPASVPWPGNWAAAGSPAACRAELRHALHLPDEIQIGVGLDRLDPASGIPEKFAAIERLLQANPALGNRFVFVQLVEPGHAGVHHYRHERRRTLEAAERVNARVGREGFQHIRVFEGHPAQATVARCFRAADLCFIGSRHDGMNLESKEFVSARDDEHGVLVLSGFAGATCELADAVVIDPTDADDAAAGLAAALAMPAAEQSQRMRRLRGVVAAHDALAWGRAIMADTARHASRLIRQ
jgi:trehalose 6-phosphate synthase